MKNITAIIIDDERLARQEMKHDLKAFADIRVVGEAAGAEEAAAMIQSLRPDLLFLDIQMPGGSGFDLLESLDQLPEVIFTTAFEEYAVKAFEINAIDYLVKPVRRERLEKAIDRIRQKVNPGEKQFFVKEGDRMHFVKAKDIFLIESAGNYARIYYGEDKVYIKKSLNQLELLLDQRSFFRISRTQIININFIRNVQALPKGKLNIILASGGVYTVSERQSVQFRNMNRLS